MIHGERTRLHPGTVCILSAPGRPFDGDMCVVEKYDSARSKWQVRLRAPEHNSKQLLVPEAVMRLAFCILPSSITLLKRHAALRDDAMQGSCGRGFILGGTDIIEKGTVLYEEPPLFITPTGTPNQHNDRWRAYLTMSMSASEGQIGMSEALKAFDDLGIADRVQDSVTAAAANIVNDAIRSAGASMSVGEREVQVQRVRDALMRFQSNQFRFENSAVPDQSANFSASAVFILTSRLNHACQPNTFVDTKKAHFFPGSIVKDDGILTAKALRPIEPGERLTLCYGPKDLPSWPLQRRREYLLEKNGFVCCCALCVAEERDGPSVVERTGAETGAAASVTEAPGTAPITVRREPAQTVTAAPMLTTTLTTTLEDKEEAIRRSFLPSFLQEKAGARTGAVAGASVVAKATSRSKSGSKSTSSDDL